MSQIQVVAQYPEVGVAVLEDDAGQFLVTENENLIPLRDKPKASVKSLIAQFVQHRPSVQQQHV